MFRINRNRHRIINGREQVYYTVNTKHYYKNLNNIDVVTHGKTQYNCCTIGHGSVVTVLCVLGEDKLTLIDSGADVSMISESYARSNLLKITETVRKFSSAGQERLDVIGTSNLSFKIGDHVISEPVFVTKNLAHDVIIGGDIFSRIKLT